MTGSLPILPCGVVWVGGGGGGGGVAAVDAVLAPGRHRWEDKTGTLCLNSLSQSVWVRTRSSVDFLDGGGVGEQ